jgi:hypothetical protein
MVLQTFYKHVFLAHLPAVAVSLSCILHKFAASQPKFSSFISSLQDRLGSHNVVCYPSNPPSRSILHNMVLKRIMISQEAEKIMKC